MAIVKSTKKTIKSHEAVFKVIEYIMNPKKAFSVSMENCCGEPYDVSKQFYVTRLAFNKDEKILSHHYIQSFSPEDNITPEQAHQMGLEFIKKIAPGYQVVLGTHIDKGHIHNHFIINSCNMKTGYKWHGNQATLNNLRKESDILCKKYGVSVIEKKSRFKSLDQTTYQLAKKGKSWKVNLVRDLDTAIEKCHSKLELIDFLNKKDYDVRYTDKHITIQKRGEKKGIRVNTLAEQFGPKYTKDSIEKIIGFYVPPEENPPERKKLSKPKSLNSEWKRFGKHIFSGTPIRDIKSNKKISEEFKKSPQKFSLKMYLYSLLKRKNNKHVIDLNITPITDDLRIKKAVKRWNVNQMQLRTVGNISYRKLSQVQGDNFKIYINADLLPKLFNQPIFYNAVLDTAKATATLTIKDTDKDLLAKIFGVTVSVLDEQNRSIKNKETYKNLYKEAAASNIKIEYLVITPEQLQQLQDNYMTVAYFKKEDKFNIAFSPKDKQRIQSILFPQKEKTETEYQKNYRINNEIKSQSALSGEKLRYKLISEEQLHQLQKAEDIKYAAFYKKDKEKYNIVYLDSDNQKINKALERQQEKQLELTL